MTQAATDVSPHAEIDNRALQAADAVLALINAMPRTPPREQLAAAIAAHMAAPAIDADNVTINPKPRVELSRDGEAFRQAAEWEVALMRASAAAPYSENMIVEALQTAERVMSAARRVWARPAASWGDVAGCAIVAAYLRWHPHDDPRWKKPDSTCRHKFQHDHLCISDGVKELVDAVERVSGVRRVRCDFHEVRP